MIINDRVLNDLIDKLVDSALYSPQKVSALEEICRQIYQAGYKDGYDDGNGCPACDIDERDIFGNIR